MSLPSIAILGVPIDTFTVDDLAAAVGKMVESRLPHYAVVADETLLMAGQRDEGLRRILIDANLTVGSGGPVLRACRLLGTPPPGVITADTLVHELANLASRARYRVFVAAKPPFDSAALAAGLQKRFPKLILGGSFALRDGLQPGGNIADLRHELELGRAQLLLVAFASPEQEQWIAAHYRQLGVPLVVATGGTLCTLSGLPIPKTSSRSLSGGGRRLKFASAVFFQRWGLRMRGTRSANTQFSSPVKTEATWQWIKLPERLDLQAVRDDVLLLDQVLADGRHCVLEMAGVKFIDSTGVGLLIRLQKKVRATGRQLVLLSPSTEVRRALSLMHLQPFFTSAPDVQAAQEIITSRVHGAEMFPATTDR